MRTIANIYAGVMEDTDEEERKCDEASLRCTQATTSINYQNPNHQATVDRAFEICEEANRICNEGRDRVQRMKDNL
jgi:SMC interacting uncharacterized protein involved in chromosome segregation